MSSKTKIIILVSEKIQGNINSRLFSLPVIIITTTYLVHDMIIIIVYSWATDFHYSVSSQYSFLVLFSRAVADHFFCSRQIPIAIFLSICGPRTTKVSSRQASSRIISGSCLYLLETSCSITQQLSSRSVRSSSASLPRIPLYPRTYGRETARSGLTTGLHGIWSRRILGQVPPGYLSRRGWPEPMQIKTKSLFRNSSATALYHLIAFLCQTLAPSTVVSKKESCNSFESQIIVSKDLANSFKSLTFFWYWLKNQPKVLVSKLSFKT